jgi:ADP-ribose pyrophosphatase YjhB (NUDIX family)
MLAQAARREVREETGLEVVELRRVAVPRSVIRDGGDYRRGCSTR